LYHSSSPESQVPDYLRVLNPEQRQAVLHKGNPLLILAGAGSGKTRVITTKIAYLIREQGVDPRGILAVTFTNKAAREMAGRARLIDDRAGDAMLRTFHSFGAWFLRRYGSLGGLDSGFVIYDEEDSLSLLSSLLEEMPRADLKTYAWNISRAKDMFLSPEDPRLDLIDHRKNFRRIYTAYEEKMAKMGNVDFGDLIKKPVEILRNYPSLGERFRERFSVLMVDEYQDANTAQFELLRELWREGTYLCVVGDDDQSIYRFRGAEVENILQFPDHFPQVDIIRLERNYRSTAPILGAASSVVKRNQGRMGKTLISERGPGKVPVLAFLPDQDEEAVFCAELITKSREAGALWSDWAILYRTNAQSLGFENEFLRRGIPYQVVGSLKFYEREEVKDGLALLAFLANPRDEVAFRRVVNKPPRGLGPSGMNRILTAAGEHPEEGLIAGAWRAAPVLTAKARAGLKVFLHAIEEGRAALEDAAGPGGKESPGETGQPAVQDSKQDRKSGNTLRGRAGLSRCLAKLLEVSGLAEYHRERDDLAGTQRLNNLQELVNASSMYPANRKGLLEFLEHLELDRSREEDSQKNEPNGVTLITLHNTKGLEFPRVILTGVEKGIFPREDKRGEDLEEERRLFYVAITRARDKLYLTSCRKRRRNQELGERSPSPFLQEIPSHLMEYHEPQGEGEETRREEGMAFMDRLIQRLRR